MKALNISLVAAIGLGCFMAGGIAEEPYEEPYWETKNPVRIFDWDTLRLLISKEVTKVKVEAKSPEQLVERLEELFGTIEGAEDVRFTFKRELWEQRLSDGTVGKIDLPEIKFELEGEDLLTVIRYAAELGGLTFSVKKNWIVFRPLIG